MGISIRAVGNLQYEAVKVAESGSALQTGMLTLSELCSYFHPQGEMFA